MLANNDIAGVSQALAEGFKTNESYWYNGFNNTPLLEAIRQSRVEIVELLLDAGADTAFATVSDTPPLVYSIMVATIPISQTFTQDRQRDALRIVDLLLERGADVDYADAKGWTPLGVAANGLEYDAALLVCQVARRGG